LDRQHESNFSGKSFNQSKFYKRPAVRFILCVQSVTFFINLNDRCGYIEIHVLTRILEYFYRVCRKEFDKGPTSYGFFASSTNIYLFFNFYLLV